MKLSLNITMVGLAIAFLTASRSISEEVTPSLLGLEYVRLPPTLCRGISASLIGKLQNEQYGSLICEQESSSYILIQKLIGYSSTEESIWKILSITKLPKLHQQEFVIQLGCHHLEIKKLTIFAIVRPIKPDDLLVIKAWRVNLIREKLEEVNAQKVVCYTPSPW
ncbi:hypothetical protein [Merismopedia glauca]|uniref:Uncharacterized protein n=1 Tax=Merismopedia glauca CCAP 1448/3 TaxID=1296344 RepID=A0A2T1C1Q1_9CYAN|nr:hypothetical protein [Merismopedia glauca]PSB02043.1 hypothetical protein C7B64_15205 [Merismopedia glauca CCAP 1448/3]